jgi:hypothetical protein
MKEMITRRQIFTGVAAFAAARFARADEERVPAFHKKPPKGFLPQTKDPSKYDAKPVVKRVYELAGKIRPVLYQQPCYCSCDQFAGHGSLLDCFVDNHGEECGICQREAVYSYVQTKAGKTPVQIRAGIMAGEWKKVDLSMSALAEL